MEVAVICSNCQNELVVDSSNAGEPFECPHCKAQLVIPQQENPSVPPPPPALEGTTEEPHYSVPLTQKPVESLIQKALPPLEMAKDGEKTIRIKTIRRSECVEVGKDLFDQKVTAFLQQIGEKNIVGVHTVNYTHQDMASKALLADYGVLVVYKG